MFLHGALSIGEKEYKLKESGMHESRQITTALQVLSKTKQGNASRIQI
jgi:hypothetical protein